MGGVHVAALKQILAEAGVVEVACEVVCKIGASH